jgi:hypothetical protein
LAEDSIRMTIVIFTTFLGLAIALIGIEMVNTPPTKKWHRWFWRICFTIFGLGVVVLTCLQYKGEEEKSKTTYDNFANVISNEMSIKQSVEEGRKSTTPNLEIVANEQVILSNAIIHITKQASRCVQFLIMNRGQGTAQNFTLDFAAPLSSTNVMSRCSLCLQGLFHNSYSPLF